VKDYFGVRRHPAAISGGPDLVPIIFPYLVTVKSTLYSVVEWGLVCHYSASKVPGTVSRSWFEIVAEVETVPGWYGDDYCFARRVGQAKRLTNRLPR